MVLEIFSGKNQKEEAIEASEKYNAKLAELHLSIKSIAKQKDLEINFVDWNNRVDEIGLIKFPYTKVDWKLTVTSPFLGLIAWFTPAWKLTSHYVRLMAEPAYQFNFFNKTTRRMQIWKISSLALVRMPNKYILEEVKKLEIFS